MSATAALVDAQRRLESLYALEAMAPVTDFLVNHEAARGLPGAGSRTLIQRDDEGVGLAVVIDPTVAERLGESDPRVKLDHRNLGAYCTAVEEVSHFVYLAFCAARNRTITELELELQGEIDKYLCACFLLSSQNDGTVAGSLRTALFQWYDLTPGLDREKADRYRRASDLAWRYSGFLESEYLRTARVSDLVREMRRFYRLGQRQKLERILIDTGH